MSREADYLVLGSTGLVGSAVAAHLQAAGRSVVGVHSRNYAASIGASARVLVNCNGNSYRYKAEQDPAWDFDASVRSVVRSLVDFRFDLYIYLSTIDVYGVLDDPARNAEDASIVPERLPPYAFHKWLAERCVERSARRYAILRVATVVGPGLKKNPVFDLLHDRSLFLSPDSTLSLIDTDTVAEVVAAIGSADAPSQILNVAPCGSVSVHEVAARMGVTPRLADGGSDIVYRYDINNRRIQRLLPMPTAHQVVERFVEGTRSA
ncbi:MAG: NAD(P)-dependent oxidoreductase [Acidimicrobiia bacterium]|nr:NAD(P)-dependent oxidoreductase [Acidimicrobiia bacterium]